MHEPRWILLLVFLLATLVGCKDDRPYSRAEISDADTAAVEDDARRSEPDVADDTRVAPDADAGPDTPDLVEFDAEPDAPVATVCYDCACECPGGQWRPYGGCFDSEDQVPDEFRSCSLDCATICPDCPDLECARPCDWYWTIEGCGTCACQPPEVAWDGPWDRERENLSLNVNVEVFIGALNRWIFTLRWDYDVPQVVDEEEALETEIAIYADFFQPSDVPATLWLDGTTDEADALEFRGASWTRYGAAVDVVMLQPVEGWMSVREIEGRFVGGASLTYSTPAGETMTASGPFDVPAHGF